MYAARGRFLQIDGLGREIGLEGGGGIERLMVREVKKISSIQFPWLNRVFSHSVKVMVSLLLHVSLSPLVLGESERERESGRKKERPSPPPHFNPVSLPRPSICK